MINRLITRWVRWRYWRWEDRQVEEIERRIAEWRGNQ
jgi:hypothetical protein